MRWFYKIILFFTSVCTIALIGSYLAMYISPAQFWPIAFLGLGYLPILFFFVLFCIYWLFVNIRIFIGLLIIFCIGFQSHKSSFALHKTGNALPSPNYKLLTYNVQGFDAYNVDGKYLHRDEMIAAIASEKPDIICLQEFNTYNNKFGEKSNLDELIKSTGLNHFHYFKAYENGNETRSFGLIILSRFPIVNTGQLKYPNVSKLNTTIFADMQIDSTIIRVYSCHLQSTQLTHKDIDFVEPSDKTSKTDFETERIVSKLKSSYEMRAEQVNVITKSLEESPYPSIICGDFNDTPVSYAYHKISADKKDAFLESGFGIGATYISFPVLRIDYLLFDEDAFEVSNYRRVKIDFSDHYPSICNFTLANN